MPVLEATAARPARNLSRVLDGALIAWLSLAESKIFERLLFQRTIDLEFVLINVQGVLDGTPVSKSWQHRFLSPLLIATLDRFTGDRQASLKLFLAVMLLAANLLLFALLRGAGLARKPSLAMVCCLGLAHLLLAYKLEYPWDGIDIVLFLAFGYSTALDRTLLAFWPWLLMGLFNHETVLYVPLWYVFNALALPQASAGARQYVMSLQRSRALWISLAVAVTMGSVILQMREHFYVGRPANLPVESFEPLTPVISNHLHVLHNLRQLFRINWQVGRAHISLGFFGATTWLMWLAWGRRYTLAALWSLCVLASIVCFGYVNETRHYLLLVAFWCSHAAIRGARSQAESQAPAHARVDAL